MTGVLNYTGQSYATLQKVQIKTVPNGYGPTKSYSYSEAGNLLSHLSWEIPALESHPS